MGGGPFDFPQGERTGGPRARDSRLRGNDALGGGPFDFPQDERTVGPGARDSRLRGNDWLEGGMAVDVAEPR